MQSTLWFIVYKYWHCSRASSNQAYNSTLSFYSLSPQHCGNDLNERKRYGEHWWYLDAMVFLLFPSTTKSIATVASSTYANRSFDDRRSHQFCAYRYEINWMLTVNILSAYYFCCCFYCAKWQCFWIFTGHIGSNDAELTPNHMNALQSQMQSKGGYEMNSLRIQVDRC